GRWKSGIDTNAGRVEGQQRCAAATRIHQVSGGRDSCGMRIGGECHTNRRLWTAKSCQGWSADDGSRHSRRRPDGLRTSWTRDFRSLLLTVSDGEKERMNQQQSDGFAYKGTRHRFGYYYNQVRDYTDFS